MSTTITTRRLARGTLLAIGLTSILGGCSLADHQAQADPATPDGPGVVHEADGDGVVTFLVDCSGEPQRAPQSFVLACGDGNIEISRTDWSSWTGNSASGTTTLDVNLCHPTCVQSKMSSFADSSVRLSGVRHTASGPVFSRATITYRHAGRAATVTAYPRT